MTRTQPRFGPLQYGIIVLTVATAAIHFSLLFPDLLFILNGLGYLALLAALYLRLPFFSQYPSIVRWVFMAYTAVTILLWALIGSRLPIAYVDKAIEVILIVLLWLEQQRALR